MVRKEDVGNRDAMPISPAFTSRMIGYPKALAPPESACTERRGYRIRRHRRLQNQRSDMLGGLVDSLQGVFSNHPLDDGQHNRVVMGIGLGPNPHKI